MPGVEERRDPDVVAEEVARALGDRAPDPIGQWVSGHESERSIHLVHQGADPSRTVLDAEHPQLGETSEQVVEDQRREGVHRRSGREGRVPLERAASRVFDVGVLAPEVREEVFVSRRRDVERDGHAGLLHPSPERIEMRMTR